MKTSHFSFFFIVVVFTSSLFMTSAFAQLTPEEQAVLQDWEIVQKAYPQTEKFNKTDEQIYEFYNRGMKYDGKLVVDNVLIDEDAEFNTKVAEIFVTLDKSDEAFYQENNQSYLRWTGSNNLYFDANSEQWLSFDDYLQTSYSNDYEQCDYDSYDEEASTESRWSKLVDSLLDILFAIIPVVFIILVFWFIFARTNKDAVAKQKSYTELMEDGIQSNQKLVESNEKLAQEISKLRQTLEDK